MEGENNRGWNVFIDDYKGDTENTNNYFIDIPLGNNGEITAETMHAFLKKISYWCQAKMDFL